jgi:single-strand DNA-binding protein
MEGPTGLEEITEAHECADKEQARIRYREAHCLDAEGEEGLEYWRCTSGLHSTPATFTNSYQLLTWVSVSRDTTFRTDDSRFRRATQGFWRRDFGKEQKGDRTMSKSVNKVILLGNVGKDPAVHILRSGTKVSVSLATSHRYQDNRGEWQERTEWHDLVAYQRTGEILRDYVRKGSKIYVEGEIRTSSWNDRDSGQRRYRKEIVVLEVSLLSPAGSSNGTSGSAQYDRADDFAAAGFGAEREITPEEIPF